jgi:pyruvate dehydrogenase complex dehydrogenase (E1) component
LESRSSIIQDAGPARGQFLVQQLLNALRQIGAADNTQPFSAYRNTIPLERQGAYPGDLAIEEGISPWPSVAPLKRLRDTTKRPPKAEIAGYLWR